MWLCPHLMGLLKISGCITYINTHKLQQTFITCHLPVAAVHPLRQVTLIKSLFMFQKIILSALLLWSFQPAPKSIYDFVIPGMDGEKIQAATKGKKLLVIIVSANTQNISR